MNFEKERDLFIAECPMAWLQNNWDGIVHSDYNNMLMKY